MTLDSDIPVGSLVYEVRFNLLGMVTAFNLNCLYELKTFTRMRNLVTVREHLIDLSEYVDLKSQKVLTDEQKSMILLIHPEIEEEVLIKSQKMMKLL